MSLARTALRIPKQAATQAAVARRFASSSAHDDHHHHQEDNTVYPQESRRKLVHHPCLALTIMAAFSTGLWRNIVLAGLAAAAFYKFAPVPGDETYLTKWIAQYSIPRETWNKANLTHLLLSVEGQQDTLVIADAKRPPVHRYRFPQYVAHANPKSFLPLIASCPVGNLISTLLILCQSARMFPWTG